ncbi:MAG: hypothetical protein JRJ29_18370 [Deltaproteobacteria bacterium]|nr:hypothetical protein [Deltaproteobacteria bacterium]
MNQSSNPASQPTPYESDSPAAEWAEQAAKHALDDLFNATFAYRTSKKYYELMQFVKRFRFYSPYNALLIHIQRPGARFVAPASRWKRLYRRHVKPNANPLVILQPMGPVMFVFDVSDTESGPDSIPLPIEVEKPFEVRRGKIGGELKWTIENAKRDGIRIHGQKTGSQAAGSIQSVKGRPPLPPLIFQIGKDKQGNPIYEEIAVRYELLLNENLSRESRYATIVHELAHLYCGHLGTPNTKWWPDRRGLSHVVVEFEAESVTYLVCERLGIDNPSVEYLANYVKTREDVPSISLECVMKAAGLIESMGCGRLKPRKKREV